MRLQLALDILMLTHVFTSHIIREPQRGCFDARPTIRAFVQRSVSTFLKLITPFITFFQNINQLPVLKGFWGFGEIGRAHV